MDIEQFVKDNYLTMIDKDIAKELNMSIGYVFSIRKRLGLLTDRSTKLRNGMTILERSGRCYELWINGVSTKDIAKQVKVSHSSVSVLVRRFLPCRSEDKITITLQSKINGD